MPKLKTNRAAAKRFRKTAKGFKGTRRTAATISATRTRKVKRQARSGGSSLVDKTDVGRLEQLLPHHKLSEHRHMARVKRGVTAGRRHKKVLGKAKGYYNARRKVYRAAKQAVIKAGQYAYRDRRQKKREFRALWITRINAAARIYGLSYSRIINGLKGRRRDRPQGARRSSPCMTRRPLAPSPSRRRPLSALA